MGEHSLRMMMQKLDEREKELHKEKLKNNDPINREFVIDAAKTFLDGIAEEVNLQEDAESSSEQDEEVDAFEPKEIKVMNLFVVDKGIPASNKQKRSSSEHKAAVHQWEEQILKSGFRDSERVYFTAKSKMNSLHPFAVTTYLPYNRKTNKQKEKSESSSTCTFSSTETEDSSPSEASD